MLRLLLILKMRLRIIGDRGLESQTSKMHMEAVAGVFTCGENVACAVKSGLSIWTGCTVTEGWEKGVFGSKLPPPQWGFAILVSISSYASAE